MKWSRLLKWGIGLPLLALVLAFGYGLIWYEEYPTEQTAEVSFVIEEDFTRVRKIMVRTDAAKEIITMGGGSEFVEQEWNQPDLKKDIKTGIDMKKIGEGALLDAFLMGGPKWEFKLNGTLKVRTLDEYVGKNVVTLEQAVEISPDRIYSVADLVKGSERLLGYGTTTQLEREDKHTRVRLTLTQKIKTDAPWFAHSIADRRVLASAEKTLANQAIAMRKLIEENIDKVEEWTFPLQ